MTVEILGYVFGDVASRASFIWVYLFFYVKAAAGGTRLIGRLRERVLL